MSDAAIPLKTRISEDMKSAMRARDTARLGAVRLLLAAIKQKEVDERIELDDAQVLSIVEKLLKQRRDAIAQFAQAGRDDLVAREQAEVDVLTAYQPAQADAGVIAAEISAAVAAAGAKGPADMGRVMAVLKPRLAGRADLAAVSAQVRAHLGSL